MRLRFGGILALDDVSLRVRAGEIVGLIGPNGAGKTSLFNVVSRLYQPERGSVRFGGRDLLATPAHRVAALGIGRTLQRGDAFGTMTVLENVLVGARADEKLRGRALEILDLLGLRRLAGQPAGMLPPGVLKTVGLARALAGAPRLLLLDEPAAGLAEEDIRGLETLIPDLRDRFEVAVLLVEHHMRLVLSVAERVHVLDFGRTIAEGTPREMQEHPAVVQAYLGPPDAAARA